MRNKKTKLRRKRKKEKTKRREKEEFIYLKFSKFAESSRLA